MLSPVAMIVCITYHASKFKETFKQEVLCASQFQAGSSCLLMIHHVMSGMSRKRWLVDQNSRRSKCQLILHQRILVFWDGSCLNFSCFNHAVSAIKDVAYALDFQHEQLDKNDSMGSDKSWWWKIFPVGRSCRGLGRGVWQDWRERRRAGGHHYCIVYIYPNQKWQQMCSCLCVRHMTILFKS